MVGDHHNCILKDDTNGNGGDVFCWGRNDFGEADSYFGGDVTDIFLPRGRLDTCFLLECW